MRVPARLLLLLLGTPSVPMPALAGSPPDDHARPLVDADIITAIDDSSSMTRLKRILAYTGLSKAVMDPDFLARIAAGPNGRVGFMAFAWSSEGTIDVIVPWMTIATARDAEKASAMFLQAIDFEPSKRLVARLTDVELALEGAVAFQDTSPFRSGHTFINICSDDASNTGASPRATRDRALVKGATISAVLFFDRPMLSDYYSRNIIGGPGAFILPISDAAAMSKLLTRKFWLDVTS